MGSILIVEDNPNLRFGLQINLEQDGHQPIIAEDGSAAITVLGEERPDLIILDLMLPDMSGFEVLRHIRSVDTWLPVLVLSASGEECDKVAAFRLGADDYVTKPFSLLELLERINTRLRTHFRTSSTPQDSQLRIDIPRRVAEIRGREVNLTPKEFDLLCALVAADGAVLSTGNLLEQVWGITTQLKTRTVDYHVGSVRRKLAAAGCVGAVRNVHSKGYAWLHRGPAGNTNRSVDS